jgi:hypothetical protein
MEWGLSVYDLSGTGASGRERWRKTKLPFSGFGFRFGYFFPQLFSRESSSSGSTSRSMSFVR